MRVSGDNLKITKGGVTFSYDDYGPVYAPVVIFIHAFPFNKSMWDMQTEALKSNYRVISYDIRGFGESSAASDDFSVDTLSSDLIHLMDLLNVRKAAVCGLSFGGTIALRAVERFPLRFTALVLSDTSCKYVIPAPLPSLGDMMETLKEEGLRAFAEKSVKRLFTSVSFLRRKEEVRAARKMIVSTPVSSILKTLQELAGSHPGCTQLEKIKVPVLILVGSEDEITPPSEAAELHRKIPGSNLKIIRYSGHLPNLENSFEFNASIRNFIDKVYSNRVLSESVIAHRV